MIINFVEIDGYPLAIEAEPDDEALMKLEPRAYRICIEQGIHLFKGTNGIHYLLDQDGNVLAYGLQTIRAYIRFFILHEKFTLS